MAFFKEKGWVYLSGLIFIGLMAYGFWNDNDYLLILPYVLVVLYVAVFYTEYTFFFILAATPLSVNIEEYTDSFGLFLPTEPLLFGTMLLLLFQAIRFPVFPSYLRNSPIVWAVVFYLFWIAFTAFTSENSVVSFKFLLAKLWFIIPVLFYGSSVFYEPKKIHWFFWLFISAMIVVITYTLVIHASYRFGEKEGHWVMWPFFKDHTIYGAIVALVIPLLFSLYFSKKHNPLQQFILIGFMSISLVGLYFSYTRAAWLSIVASLVIWLLIRCKVRFSFLATLTVIAGLYIWFSWNQIEQSLARNKYEHTTENFGERFQSATNVTTDASNLERINRWNCAIDMFKERPLTGFGPGMYAFEYARFQRPENLTIISTNFGNLGNAHSEYLGALAEMGLFGMLSMLAIVAAIFYEGITLYNKWPVEDRETKTLLMGMILSLSTYFIHAFLNNYLDTDKAAVPIWAMCAIFIALRARLKNLSRQEIK